MKKEELRKLGESSETTVTNTQPLLPNFLTELVRIWELQKTNNHI